MVGFNFISVTKAGNVEWVTLLEPVRDIILKNLNSNDPLVDPQLMEKAMSSSAGSDDSESIKKIKDILDNEIRPAVAMDGGDIIYRSYEEGILTLFLQGACSSCPASTMTLKMGIENRLKEELPDLKEVVQEF